MKKKNQLSKHDAKALVEAFNSTGGKLNIGVPKSQRKGFSDLPLFFEDNQGSLFEDKPATTPKIKKEKPFVFAKGNAEDDELPF